MFKTKFRIVLHPDREGFPNCWLIQYSKWYERGWTFYSGYFESYDDAEINLNSKSFIGLKGMFKKP